jgi:two-component system response regulator FixJ
MSEPVPTVYIVDDDDEVRESLADLVDSVGLVAQTFANAPSFLSKHCADDVGCLLLDIRMPGMSGLDLQQILDEQNSTLPVIFISGHGDVPMAVEAMRRGAVDFIEKPYRDQELLDRINGAIETGQKRQNDRVEIDKIKEHFETLTPREREVMGLIVQGQANKVIAIDLGLSQRTVEVHRARVMEKMQVRSLAQLVRAHGRLEPRNDRH